MRRVLSAGLLFTALFVTLAGVTSLRAEPALEPEVTVVLGVAAIEGRGWENGTPLTVTVRGPAGNARAVCTATPSPAFNGIDFLPGFFSCSWGDGFLRAPAATLPANVVRPGDTVTVEQGARVTTSEPLGHVEILRVSPAPDRISGLVPRRNRRTFARVTPGRSLFGPPRPEFTAFGRAAADGRFTLDLTARGDIARHDGLLAGYASGVFRVVRLAIVPGIDAVIDGNSLSLSGYPGKRYVVRLFSPSGAQKAAATATVGLGIGVISSGSTSSDQREAKPSRGGYTNISFTRPSGQPVAVRSGDTIRVDGWSGFSCRVPPLLPGFDGGLAFVKTLPNLAVRLGAYGASTGVSDEGTTDADGLFTLPLPVGMLPLAPGDEVSASIEHQGNFYSARRYLAP